MAENRTYTKRNTTPAPIPANEFGNCLPQAPELEEAVLGAIMLETDAYSLVSEILRPECFYKVAHQKIYEAIIRLATKQEPIDMHTVTEQLRKDGTIDDVGGPYYITLLTAKVSSAAHLEYHARIVMQKYLARELIRISSEIQTKAFDDKTDVDDLMEEAEGMLFQVTQQNLKKDAVQIFPVVEEARNRMIQAASKEGASGIASGFHALDKITSGWQRSDLIIIAARPAMGKTAFVLSMAKNMAVDYKVPVAVFSLEMSNVQLVNRLIMNVCEIEGDKIKKGNLSPAEWDMFDRKIKILEDAPIYVDDTPSLSVFELRSKARRLVKEHGVQCIIIDYLQLMNASGMNFGSREQEVSMISRSLKGLAKELDIPIIALSQLNRGVEGRTGIEGKRPQLSGLARIRGHRAGCRHGVLHPPPGILPHHGGCRGQLAHRSGRNHRGQAPQRGHRHHPPALQKTSTRALPTWTMWTTTPWREVPTTSRSPPKSTATNPQPRRPRPAETPSAAYCPAVRRFSARKGENTTKRVYQVANE